MSVKYESRQEYFCETADPGSFDHRNADVIFLWQTAILHTFDPLKWTKGEVIAEDPVWICRVLHSDLAKSISESLKHVGNGYFG